MHNIWINPNFFQTKSAVTIFADRDGTLIRHLDYLSDPDQVELLPGVKDRVTELIERKIPFFILTNQSGVGRGYFPIEQVHACQQRLLELLEITPQQIAGWCIAPEAPGTAGGYRKPSPRFIREACGHLEIAPESCHVIGDTMVDLETAWAAGARAWAVGCGKPELPERIRQGAVEGAYEFRDSFEDCIQSILEGADPSSRF